MFINHYKPLLEQLFMPSEFYTHVTDISLSDLQQKNISTLFLDADNTLLTYDEKLVGMQAHQWVSNAKRLGFKCFILSNNSSKKRIKRICDQLEIEGVYFACKPFSWSIQDLIRDHDIQTDHSAIIGDQLFKDVLLGNWLKMHSILVDPIDIKTSFGKTFQRDIELKLLAWLEN